MSDLLLKELANSEISPQKKAFALLKAYFLKSNEKATAWLYLFGIFACVIAMVGFSLALTWWSAAFWPILMAKVLEPFLLSLAQFAGFMTGMIFFTTLKNELIGKLAIRWRKWITDNILSGYLKNANYLKLARIFPEITHIDQRIQEDVQKLTLLALNIAADVFRAILSIGSFAGTLWVVGGSLAIGLNIVIPGYMLWAALIIAITATVATHFLARSLAKKNAKVETAEATFRRTIGDISKKSENIAMEKAEDYHRLELEKHFKTLLDRSNDRLNSQSKLIGFQSLYMQLGFIIPYVLAAPAIMAGSMSEASLMSVTMSFMEVNSALSCLVTLYESITNCRTSIERILALTDALQKRNLHANDTDIKLKALKAKARKSANKDCINVVGLTIKPPLGHKKILQNLTLKLKPGEHTCIGGESGLGKSTFFKVLAGTWKFGQGKVFLPHGKKMCFLPQFPTLIEYGSLKELLAFPDSKKKYHTKDYLRVLKAVGLEELSSQLREEKNWSFLSPGQQQRIAFARAILKQPDWLFLDEATSALDLKSEERVYNAIKGFSPKTTIVSIAHRETVPKFHDRQIYFRKGKHQTRVEEGHCHEVPSFSRSPSESSTLSRSFSRRSSSNSSSFFSRNSDSSPEVSQKRQSCSM